jgi:hypothetical protein
MRLAATGMGSFLPAAVCCVCARWLGAHSVPRRSREPTVYAEIARSLPVTLKSQGDTQVAPLIDTSYAVARQAGGLEGASPPRSFLSGRYRPKEEFSGAAERPPNPHRVGCVIDTPAILSVSRSLLPFHCQPVPDLSRRRFGAHLSRRRA